MLPLKRSIAEHVDLEEASSSKFRTVVDYVDVVDSDDEKGQRAKVESVDLNLYLRAGAALTPEPRLKKRDYLEHDQAIAQLLAIFPDVCPNDAASKLALMASDVSKEQALQAAIDYYLVYGVTKVQDEVIGTLSAETTSHSAYQEKGKKIDTAMIDDPFKLEIPPPEAGNPYLHWCLYRMSSEFPRVKMADLGRALKLHKGRLGPAYKSVYYACQRAFMKEGNLPASKDVYVDKDEASVMWVPKEGLKLMRYPRVQMKDPRRVLSPVFEEEWVAVQRAFAKEKEKVDEAVAKELNREEYELPGQEIECGCCCSEFPFQEMVQCADGHLFCFGCLRRRVEESTFGGLQACGSLPCMDTNGCTESFPLSEVKRALPADILSKYEQRQAEDAVARARLEGLVYCPFCNLPWEVDPGLFILECPNEACKKASCIKCKEPSHVPLRCEEVEKQPETCLRKRIEEIMTKALIRECSSCKAELVKSEGCNKITCRCGQSMCYVCREPIQANYKHFCQHVREPGQPCMQCNQCSLWEQESEDEVIRAAKEAALKELADTEPEFVKRTIGPGLQPVTPEPRWPDVPDFPWQPPFYGQNAAAPIPQHEWFHRYPWAAPVNLALPPRLALDPLLLHPENPNFPVADVIANGQAYNRVPVVARFHNLLNHP